MGIFSGAATATTTKSSEYFKKGKYVMLVNKCKLIKPSSAGLAAVVEGTILKTLEGAHTVGDEVSHYQDNKYEGPIDRMFKQYICFYEGGDPTAKVPTSDEGDIIDFDTSGPEVFGKLKFSEDGESVWEEGDQGLKGAVIVYNNKLKVREDKDDIVQVYPLNMIESKESLIKEIGQETYDKYVDKLSPIYVD